MIRQFCDILCSVARCCLKMLCSIQRRSMKSQRSTGAITTHHDSPRLTTTHHDSRSKPSWAVVARRLRRSCRTLCAFHGFLCGSHEALNWSLSQRRFSARKLLNSKAMFAYSFDALFQLLCQDQTLLKCILDTRSIRFTPSTLFTCIYLTASGLCETCLVPSRSSTSIARFLAKRIKAHRVGNLRLSTRTRSRSSSLLSRDCVRYCQIAGLKFIVAWVCKNTSCKFLSRVWLVIVFVWWISFLRPFPPDILCMARRADSYRQSTVGAQTISNTNWSTWQFDVDWTPKENDLPEHMMIEGFRWSIGNLDGLEFEDVWS